MSLDTLIRMANQIAAFFQPYPHAEAVEGTARHLRDFWDPEMRRQLAAHARAGGAGLSPLAREAAEALDRSEAAA